MKITPSASEIIEVSTSNILIQDAGIIKDILQRLELEAEEYKTTKESELTFVFASLFPALML